jgi:hypothetical protein
MNRQDTLDLTAPAVAERILKIANDSSTELMVLVENRGVNSASIEYQESDDGSTWSTIVGTSVFVDPNAANRQLVVSSRKHVALYANGNVLLLVHVGRQYNNPVQPISI